MIKEILKTLLDFIMFIIICSIIGIGVSEIKIIRELGDGPVLVLSLNLLIPSLSFYFGFLRSSDKDDVHWEDYFNYLLWGTGVMGIVHSFIGYVSYRHGQTRTLPALWEEGKEAFINGIAIYLIFYLTWLILYRLAKKYKWRTSRSKKKSKNDFEFVSRNRRKPKVRRKIKKTYGKNKKKR